MRVVKCVPYSAFKNYSHVVIPAFAGMTIFFETVLAVEVMGTMVIYLLRAVFLEKVKSKWRRIFHGENSHRL
jgi:hypothetical protein